MGEAEKLPEGSAVATSAISAISATSATSTTSAAKPTLLVEVRLDRAGRPAGAAAAVRVERPVARVWAVVCDVERYAGRVPMIHRVRRDGNRVIVDLKFRVAFLSAGFQFTADVVTEPERWLEIRWVAGEPRGIRLRFELEPLDGGSACRVRGEGEFEVQSLGWLVKYFLKHHPEIEFGVFPGVALALIDSMRRASETD